jgi:hypothetical protein
MRVQAKGSDMPLHDWSELGGWEGMHLLWMSELVRYLKTRLPDGFRAYLGTGPAVAVGAPAMRPDVGVRSHEHPDHRASSAPETASPDPDIEIAVAALESVPTLFVERDDRLVSAVELVSPRNKDRLVARTTYLSRYAGYLIEGVHLLLVDVHRRPARFSFADAIAREMALPPEPELAPPLAVSYRVGEPAAQGGRLLAMWRRALVIGAPLPSLPLPLTIEQAVQMDLEASYMRAASDAYIV